jgi:hypothetical protein
MFDFVSNLFAKKEPPKPETFEEAVEYVSQRIEKDTVDSPYFHFTGGMSVRNTLGLWDKESPLYKHMLDRFGLCHADDTGSLITQAAHAKKNGVAYEPELDVIKFKAHWRAMGLDPATMKEVASST